MGMMAGMIAGVMAGAVDESKAHIDSSKARQL
jgi:hypothetical protein